MTDPIRVYIATDTGPSGFGEAMHGTPYTCPECGQPQELTQEYNPEFVDALFDLPCDCGLTRGWQKGDYDDPIGGRVE